MKLLLASLLSVSSLLIASPAKAKCLNGWCEAGCTKDGNCGYVKVIKMVYPYVTFRYNRPDKGKFMIQANCEEFKSRIIRSNGTKRPWVEAMPGTMRETYIRQACGMR